MSSIDNILDHYERGRLTRRQLVQNLAAVLVPVAVSSNAAAADSVVVGRSISHVQLTVASIGRSKEFYTKLLGTKDQGSTQEGRVEALALRGNAGWISLRQAKDPKGKIGQLDHYAIGVANFKADRIAAAVRKAFPDIKVDETSRSVFLADPDGFRLQIISKDDTGG